MRMIRIKYVLVLWANPNTEGGNSSDPLNLVVIFNIL